MNPLTQAALDARPKPPDDDATRIKAAIALFDALACLRSCKTPLMQDHAKSVEKALDWYPDWALEKALSVGACVSLRADLPVSAEDVTDCD